MNRKPVASCTVCGQVSHNPAAINQRCGNRVGRKRCRGVYGSMLAPNDWAVCTMCNGTGCSEGKKCDPCRGEGWIAQR